MNYYIGYDIGSSSIKAALVEAESGKPITVVQEPEKEMEIKALYNGWAEQNPEDWYTCVVEATRQLLSKSEIDPQKIIGIGIAYQMHGLTLVDRQGALLRDAIIWCDSRAVEIGNKAYTQLGAEKCKTHLLNSPGNFTASKLKWVKDNEPELYGKIHKFMLPGDYIAYKLTGTINTTISGLSEGIIWDFKEEKPADWLLAHYELDKNLIPDQIPTFGDQGKISAEASKTTGLPQGIPVLYRAGDQPNNALSLNVFQPGEVAATGGTSGVVYAVTDNLSVEESERVNNFVHVNHNSKNLRIGKLLCINGAGIQYRWLLNNLDVGTYEEMNHLAAGVPVGSEEVCIIPFGNGAERMLKNVDVGTHIVGLNLNNHTKAHLCRAALEGIAFSFAYGVEILRSDGIKVDIIRAGNDNLFRSELFSNTVASLIGGEIEIYNTTGAIGAARAANLYKGDYEAFGKQIMENDYVMSFKPRGDNEAYQKAYRNWKKELELILKHKQ